jgi:Kef-type K+ transport system membrane component KefB
VGAAIVLGPIVATRLRLPAIIGLLAGGLVIGPAVLGIVPATDTTVAALGQLGLLYLMFTAGVELDLLLFKRYRKAALTFGLMTFSAPMLLGFGAGRLLDYSFPASLLLGSLWASHTLVTYPMVRQAGLSGERAVATTVGATLITDTLSLIVLAGVSGSVTGGGSLVQIVGSLLLGLVVLVFYALVVLPRGTRWFFSHLAHTRDERYSFLLAAMLSAAVLSEMVGIEGIVGAFFAGLGVNRLIPAGSALMERVEFFGSSLLVPVFLVSVGVIIKPSVMVQPATLGLAAVFCVAVIGGKSIAAYLARPVLGFTGPESGLMLGLSLSQAAATLAATFVGYDIGLFGEQVVNAVLVVILVTLLMAAVVTSRAIERSEPVPDESEVGIGRKVILAAGCEDRLAALARVAGALVEADAGMVVPLRLSRSSDDVEADRQLLHLAEATLAQVGLDCEGRQRLDDNPTSAIAYTTVEEGATAVLMDWQAASRHQPALRGERDDGLLGSAPVPVVLAAMSDTPWSRVVLALDPVDEAPESATDLALAIDVATRLAQGETERLLVGTAAGEFSEHVEPGDRGQWVHDQARPGDIVVIPAHPSWEAFGPTAVRASALAGVSAVVVADPERWRNRGSALERGIGVLVGDTNTSVRWS